MSTSIDELYRDRILDEFESPYHRGHCRRPTHAEEGENPLCGDAVRIELEVNGDRRIGKAYFCGDGCCISQAAASLLVRHIEGKSLDEAVRFSAEDMLRLFEARLTPNRQKCCLLCWRVLQQALCSPINPEVSG
jgi:nitrogen fixation NifU-like protein